MTRDNSTPPTMFGSLASGLNRLFWGTICENITFGTYYTASFLIAVSGYFTVHGAVTLEGIANEWLDAGIAEATDYGAILVNFANVNFALTLASMAAAGYLIYGNGEAHKPENNISPYQLRNVLRRARLNQTQVDHIVDSINPQTNKHSSFSPGQIRLALTFVAYNVLMQNLPGYSNTESWLLSGISDLTGGISNATLLAINSIGHYAASRGFIAAGKLIAPEDQESVQEKLATALNATGHFSDQEVERIILDSSSNATSLAI